MPRKLKGGAIVDASVTSTQLDSAINDKITNAYNQANTALSTGGSGSAQANAAYAQANAAYGQANNAYNAANNAAVRVSANSGAPISANTISFNNTTTVSVVVEGSGSNANISFVAAPQTVVNDTYTAAGNVAAAATANIANGLFAIATNSYGQANAAYGQANASYGQANSAYGQANAAYGQANAAYGQANAAYGAANLKLNLTGGSINGDLYIGGNLTVEGVGTQINVSNLSVNDSIILLSANAVGDALDIGFVGHFDRGATNTHAGLIRKASENRFYLFDNYEVEPTNNVIDVNGNNFRVGNLRLGIINANSFVTVAGLNVTDQANSAFSAANGAYAQANGAYTQANGAYAQANGAYAQANGAYAQANGAYAQANGAFGAANAVYNAANSAANTVRVSQNSASSLSARQLNFVNTGNVKIVVTDSGDGNANIALDATISRTNTSIYNQSFIAANGNGNLTYTLNYTPWGVDYVSVYKNGISLTPTIEYTLTGNVVTVVPGGETNDDIDIRYIVDASFVPQSNTTIIIDANTVTAQTNTFYLSQNVASINRLAISKNGLRLTPNSHYTLTNNNTVTLAAVAEVDDQLVFEYFFDLGNVVDWTLAYNQANNAFTAANNRVLKAGDTMTGNLLISGATLNTATANISTIVTGNNLTLSTGAASNGSIIFSANNAEDMRILANGNIGVGTTAPTSKFEIFNGSNTVYYGVYGRDRQGYFGQDSVGLAVYQGANSPLYLSTNALERMRITNDGNVGIGTTSPGVKLDVFAGDISIRASEGVNTRDSRFLRIFRGSYGGDQAGVIFGTGPSTENWFIGHPYSGGGVFNALIISEKPVIFDGNAVLQKTPSMYFSTGAGTAAGNVGIGTTNPTAQGLTIHQGGGDRRVLLELNRPNTPGLQTAIEFTVGGSIMVGRIQHEYEAANQNHMSFSLRSPGSTNFEILRLKNNGNVGFGTTNPTSHSGSNGAVIIQGVGGRGLLELWDSGGTGKAVFQQVGNTSYIGNLAGNGPLHLLVGGNGTSATEAMVITNGGQVTTANQPAFVAHADTNQEPTSTTKLAYTGITLNRGNHYNTSTSRFTAPVTGLYSFNVRWWYKVNATGLAQLFVYKNGSAVIETRFRQAASVSDFITQLFKTTMYLIAGDYIEVYGTGNGTDSFHSSTSYYYSEFSGYLLG